MLSAPAPPLEEAPCQIILAAPRLGDTLPFHHSDTRPQSRYAGAVGSAGLESVGANRGLLQRLRATSGTSLEEGLELHVRRDIKDPHTLRPEESLVTWNRKEADAQRLDVDGETTRGLGRVHQEGDTARAETGPYFRDRQYRSEDVGSVRESHESGVGTDGCQDVFGVGAAVAGAGHPGDSPLPGGPASPVGGPPSCAPGRTSRRGAPGGPGPGRPPREPRSPFRAMFRACVALRVKITRASSRMPKRRAADLRVRRRLREASREKLVGSATRVGAYVLEGLCYCRHYFWGLGTRSGGVVQIDH